MGPTPTPTTPPPTTTTPTSMEVSATVEGFMVPTPRDDALLDDFDSDGGASSSASSSNASSYTSDWEDRHGPIRAKPSRTPRTPGTTARRHGGGRAEGSHCRCKCCGQ